MLHKCANPECSNAFRHLREGKLFLVENEYFPRARNRSRKSRRPPLLRHMEHFWLCGGCSQQLTLTFDRERGMITVPLSSLAARKMPRSEAPQYEDIPSKELLGA